MIKETTTQKQEARQKSPYEKIGDYVRRMTEKDRFAILIQTEEGVKIVETFPFIEALKNGHKSYSAFAKSSYYPENTCIPFPAEFKSGVNFEGPLEYQILREDDMIDKKENIPWRPTRREMLVPFIGSGEYVGRWRDYFKSRNWPFRSPNEMYELEEDYPAYSESEERRAYKNFSTVKHFLALRDILSVFGGLYAVTKLVSSVI